MKFTLNFYKPTHFYYARFVKDTESSNHQSSATTISTNNFAVTIIFVVIHSLWPALFKTACATYGRIKATDNHDIIE